MEFYRPYIDENEKKEIEPNNLVKAAKKFIDLCFTPETIGKEHLDEIPAGKKVIIATTHISDFDMPIAIAEMGDYFPNINVANKSNQFEFTGDPVMNLQRYLIGQEHYFRVEHRGKKGGGNEFGVFDPENFQPMKESLEDENTMIIAAQYDDQYHAKQKWALSDRPGNGAAYLHQITPDSVILPVAVDIKADPIGMGKMGSDVLRIIKREKPPVDVIIGKPLELDKIDGLEAFNEIFKKRKRGEKLTIEERHKFSQFKEKLQSQSSDLIKRLADLLPKEKRGIWDDDNENIGK